MNFFHWVTHLFGWNTGEVYTWWDDDNDLMVGFKCDGCASITHVGKAGVRR